MGEGRGGSDDCSRQCSGGAVGFAHLMYITAEEKFTPAAACSAPVCVEV